MNTTDGGGEYKTKPAPTRASTVLRYHCGHCGAVLGEYGSNHGRAALNIPGWLDIEVITGRCAACGQKAVFRRTDMLFDALMEKTVGRHKIDGEPDI